MGNTRQTVNLQFKSPEAAEQFINEVGQDQKLRPKVSFLLSVGQRIELRGLRRAARRPHETPLNVRAFIIVCICGALLFFIVDLSANWLLPEINTVTVALGILVATLSGAIAALGLPSRPSSTERILNIKVNCDSEVSEPLIGIAQKYCTNLS